MAVMYLGMSFNEMNSISYAITDARGFLDLPELAQRTEKANVEGSSIRLDNVRFSYDEGAEVIHGISLGIPSGSRRVRRPRAGASGKGLPCVTGTINRPLACEMPNAGLP